MAGGSDGSLAVAPSTRDRAREFGTIDAVLDEGSVDVNRDDFAECQPRLGLPALGILQSNDFGKPSLFLCQKPSNCRHHRNSKRLAHRKRKVPKIVPVNSAVLSARMKGVEIGHTVET